MFEIVQFVESGPGDETLQTVVGESSSLERAIEIARQACRDFQGDGAYAWWVVREPGQQLARWISDNKSHKEFTVDLRSGALVEIRV